MHKPLPTISRALRRSAPLAAAIAALAAPSAFAAGGPGVTIDYNASQVRIAGFAGGAVPITITRGNATVFSTTVTLVGGAQNVNVPGIVAPEPFVCWGAFTPEILPGDVVNVDGNPITIPNTTVEAPVQDGADLVLHGIASDVAGAPLPIGELDAGFFSKTARFADGAKGGQQISVQNHAATTSAFITYDAPGSTHWTARFSGLSAADRAIAINSATAQGTWSPLHAVGALGIVTNFDTPAVANGAGCGAVGRSGVTGTDRPVINAANAATPLVVSGVSQPDVSAVSLLAGASTIPALSAGGTWTATIPTASLPEGVVTLGARFTAPGGTFPSGTATVTKDTIAPNAPTASIAAGTYSDTQNVALRSNEGTIHYTLDGSDPTVASKSYRGAIGVANTATIKAIAVDDAGNVSDVASIGYTIARPQPAPARAPVVAPIKTPKLKLDALTISSRMSLRTVRKRGMSMVVFAPEGAKVVKVRLVRNGRTIDQVVRKVTADGVLTVALPHSRRARRALRRGTYQVLVTPGKSVTKLGATTKRTVRIR